MSVDEPSKHAPKMDVETLEVDGPTRRKTIRYYTSRCLPVKTDSVQSASPVSKINCITPLRGREWEHLASIPIAAPRAPSAGRYIASGHLRITPKPCRLSGGVQRSCQDIGNSLKGALNNKRCERWLYRTGSAKFGSISLRRNTLHVSTAAYETMTLSEPTSKLT